MKHILYACLINLFVLLCLRSQAQVLPVGTPVLEDYYRREQLQGRVDSSVSFTIRPLHNAALRQENLYDPEQQFKSEYQYSLPDGKGFIQFLPVTWESQVNTTYPYGWNDGSMIPSRGYQSRFSAGIYAQYRFLNIQFRPEIVTAATRQFENHAKQPGYGLEWYNAIGNHIDMPEYFGSRNYSRILPGQSSIRLTFNPVSAGLSTENLWWGPGKRNSLLMSNTAPGFLHATIQTTRPVQSPVGSFEAQLVGGKLQASGYLPSITGESLHQEMYYVEKPDDWRYFSGYIVNYQPKWIKGLSLGFIRSFTTYRKDMTGNPRDYLPFFSPTLKGTDYLDDKGQKHISNDVRDRYGSVFFRWVMPAGGFEVYGEYGRREKPENGRDWMVESTRSRAYIVGFTKLILLNRVSGASLQVSAEATELAAPNAEGAQYTASWYTDDVVRDGYTNRGQVLGAGIGPGSNVQSVDVSWVRGLQQIGLQFERFSHNEDFFNIHIRDIRRSWADLGILAHASWDFKQVLATAGIQYIHAYNYQHLIDTPPANFWDFGPHDKNNVNLRFGISYRF